MSPLTQPAQTRTAIPLFFVLLLTWPERSEVEGHGRLIDPPSRASMWRFGFDTKADYDDNQGYCGGKSQLWNRFGGRCGVCGDPWRPRPRAHERGGRYYDGRPARVYRQGDVITTVMAITANHRGWVEFRLCPYDQPAPEDLEHDRRGRFVEVTQTCLDKHLLQLADGSGTRFYLPEPYRVGQYSVDIRLPPWVSCDKCLLQWKWNVANSWGTDPDGTSCVGCGNQEQFYACADVVIESSSWNNEDDYDPHYPDYPIYPNYYPIYPAETYPPAETNPPPRPTLPLPSPPTFTFIIYPRATEKPSTTPAFVPFPRATEKPSTTPAFVPFPRATKKPSTTPAFVPFPRATKKPSTTPAFVPFPRATKKPSTTPAFVPFPRATEKPSTTPAFVPFPRATEKPSTTPAFVPFPRATKKPSTTPSFVPFPKGSEKPSITSMVMTFSKATTEPKMTEVTTLHPLTTVGLTPGAKRDPSRNQPVPSFWQWLIRHQLSKQSSNTQDRSTTGRARGPKGIPTRFWWQKLAPLSRQVPWAWHSKKTTPHRLLSIRAKKSSSTTTTLQSGRTLSTSLSSSLPPAKTSPLSPPPTPQTMTAKPATNLLRESIMETDMVIDARSAALRLSKITPLATNLNQAFLPVLKAITQNTLTNSTVRMKDTSKSKISTLQSLGHSSNTMAIDIPPWIQKLQNMGPQFLFHSWDTSLKTDKEMPPQNRTIHDTQATEFVASPQPPFSQDTKIVAYSAVLAPLKVQNNKRGARTQSKRTNHITASASHDKPHSRVQMEALGDNERPMQLVSNDLAQQNSRDILLTRERGLETVQQKPTSKDVLMSSARWKEEETNSKRQLDSSDSGQDWSPSSSSPGGVEHNHLHALKDPVSAETGQSPTGVDRGYLPVSAYSLSPLQVEIGGLLPLSANIVSPTEINRGHLPVPEDSVSSTETGYPPTQENAVSPGQMGNGYLSVPEKPAVHDDELVCSPRWGWMMYPKMWIWCQVHCREGNCPHFYCMCV